MVKRKTPLSFKGVFQTKTDRFIPTYSTLQSVSLLGRYDKMIENSTAFFAGSFSTGVCVSCRMYVDKRYLLFNNPFLSQNLLYLLVPPGRVQNNAVSTNNHFYSEPPMI